jgi:hypothetical protein
MAHQLHPGHSDDVVHGVTWPLLGNDDETPTWAWKSKPC